MKVVVRGGGGVSCWILTRDKSRFNYTLCLNLKWIPLSIVAITRHGWEKDKQAETFFKKYCRYREKSVPYYK